MRDPEPRQGKGGREEGAPYLRVVGEKRLLGAAAARPSLPRSRHRLHHVTARPTLFP